MRVLFIKQDHVSAAGPVAEAFADLGYDVADLLVVASAGRAHALVRGFTEQIATRPLAG